MRKIMPITIILLAAFSFSYAQMPTPGYHLIIGNPDGSVFYALADAIVDIPMWGATPAVGSGYEDLNGDGVVDSINFFSIPVITRNVYIPARYPPVACGVLTQWDDISFMQNNIGGNTQQTIIGFADLFGSPSPLFNTNGDTVIMMSLPMHTTGNPDSLYRIICPFVNSPQSYPLWGMQDGVTAIIPSETYSCLFLVDYLPGDANGSGDVNGLDVTYLVSYLKGNNPPPDPFFGGDANGDCMVNGMDVVYLVAYFKGGAGPFYGDCY